uniref:Uncharacterized protein n=1 Tax=Anguilla anguilla TaxID=7936 RepID=A0A0E9XWD3_ANGAN
MLTFPNAVCSFKTASLPT